ncbi:MAG: o-succinylbenzoate synthase [Cryomorphaceae bacterium]|nr:o-succinylbenzoate synthase [Cryomorphaceae bacterium]
MKITLQHFPLHFKVPAGTSRGVMTEKQSWIVRISDGISEGIGEISVIEDLSPEYISLAEFELTIKEFLSRLEQGWNDEVYQALQAYSSILFGIESALLDLKNGGKQIYFDNAFARGQQKIPINGLIWMGSEAFMAEQITQKLAAGFTTIKMKIGAMDLDTELELLQSIRKNYSKEEITLRVDANGAFDAETAQAVLQKLADLDIHSIEQPIKAGNIEAMKKLCLTSPTPIALDEELIGIYNTEEKIKLLETIQPQYIILKPSLHGGISGTKEWIALAEERNIQWWMTSALESNVGLEVICQLAGEYSNSLPQGLGTGSLYTNNSESPLTVAEGMIFRVLS